MEYRSDSERIAASEQMLMDIKESLIGIKHDLFGNGQPGALTKLDDRVRSLEAQSHQSMGRRAVWIAIGSGALVVIDFLDRAGLLKLHQ